MSGFLDLLLYRAKVRLDALGSPPSVPTANKLPGFGPGIVHKKKRETNQQPRRAIDQAINAAVA